MNDKDALYHAVHDYPGGALSLAPRMGVAASTLQSMANPNLDSHDWPYKRVKQVMHLTDDVRPLEALCAEFGGLFVRLPVATGKSADELYRELAHLSREFGDVPRTIEMALKDGRLKPKEFERIKNEVMQLQQAAAAVLKVLEPMVEQPPKNR